LPTLNTIIQSDNKNDSNDVIIQTNKLDDHSTINPSINEKPQPDIKEKNKIVETPTEINNETNITPSTQIKPSENDIVPEKDKKLDIIKEKDNQNEVVVKNKEIKELSPRVASKITNEYIRHDKEPETLEGWQELKHIFMKWKNINNNNEELIKNPQYVAWFRRNCNDNKTPESKIDKITDFLHLDIDANDENSPIRINNYLNKIKKDRESHEPMPYEEWFNKNCEKPSISTNDFILPFEKTYNQEKLDEPLISLKDIIEQKSNTDIKDNKEGEEKNKNTPYNEKEMKSIYNFINGGY